MKANDLAITVEAAEKVTAGETTKVKATVENVGENAAQGYTVVIKAGDKELLNETVNDALGSFAKNVLEADFATTVFDEAGDVTITAEVVFDADLNNDNNTANTVVTINEPKVAQPENVSAEETEDGIVVTWDAPESSTVDATEDFEEGMGGFTAIDADEDENNWIHHINAGGGIIPGNSGEGKMVSYSYDNATYNALTPDNWLITPKAVLDGTFKFYAKAVDPNYSQEHFAVYVSTESGTDVATFEQVTEEYVAATDYAEYTVDLSSYAGQEGWVAIRHFNCTDMFALAIDDVTYTMAAQNPTGYNIYLDGELVGTVTEGEEFTIEDYEAGSHTVAVTATYENGQESKPVEVQIEITGIMQLTITNEPVDVYTIDGKLVRKNATTLSGLKGAYVVNGKKFVVK